MSGAVVGGGRLEDLRLGPGALFSSDHSDENDLQTISHKCVVVPGSGRGAADSDLDTFYEAGEFDPTVGTIIINVGVIS